MVKSFSRYQNAGHIMDLKQHIGVRIREARLRKGLTQERFAEKLGKATETISNIERGQAFTGLETLQLISKVLGVRLGYFFDDFEDTKRISRSRAELEMRAQLVLGKLTDKNVGLGLALLSTLVEQQDK